MSRQTDDSESTALQRDETTRSSTSNRGERWYQRLKNWLWGYDFFISYHWASGGTYAVNLAARLREKGYDVFLDRAEYAMGDKWKGVGEVALRNTQRLVLIATREAVFESKPVEREVVLFTNRSCHCIPVFFGDTFAAEEQANPGKYIVLDRLPDDTLYIEDTIENLDSAPAPEVVEKLASAHGIMRRLKLRQTITVTAITVLTIFAIVATIAAVTAVEAKNEAVEANTKLRAELVESRAATIMAKLSDEKLPTKSDYAVLKVLADSDEGEPLSSEYSVRMKFVEQLLKSAENAERLRPKLPYLLQAIVGLDRQMKEKVLRDLAERLPASDDRINMVYADLATILQVERSDLCQRFAVNLVAAMERTTDESMLLHLARSLVALGDEPPNEQVRVAAQRITVVMKQTSDPDKLKILADALGRLGKQLPADHVSVAAQHIANTMERTKDSDQFFKLSLALRLLVSSLGKDLLPEHAAEITRHAIATMEHVGNADRLFQLGLVLKDLREKLTPQQAAIANRRVFHEMEKIGDAYEMQALARMVFSCDGSLSQEEAVIAAKTMTTAMEKATDPHALSDLASLCPGWASKYLKNNWLLVFTSFCPRWKNRNTAFN